MKCFLFEFWDLELVHLKDKIPSLPDKFQGWCSYMAQGAKVCFIRCYDSESLNAQNFTIAVNV